MLSTFMSEQTLIDRMLTSIFHSSYLQIESNRCVSSLLSALHSLYTAGETENMTVMTGMAAMTAMAATRNSHAQPGVQF